VEDADGMIVSFLIKTNGNPSVINFGHSFVEIFNNFLSACPIKENSLK
jgi:hypothetical protein